MNIDENVVESIVKRVVSQLSTETASAQTCPSGGDCRAGFVCRSGIIYIDKIHKKFPVKFT